MRSTKTVLQVACLGLACFSSGAALAQNFPSKPIHIVTSAPGATGDFAARLIAQGMSLGQPVIIDNRGGHINIPGNAVAKAPADGYTLLFNSNGMWTVPLLERSSFDVTRELAPVSMTNMSPNMLVISATLPVNSVKELIALAKSQPGNLNYASGGAGTNPHATMELFKMMTQVNIVHIPYKGVGPAFTSLISGETKIMFAPPASAAPHLKSGRLKALAITSLEPSVLAPGLPTVAASGVPDFESVAIYGIWTTAQTPAAVIGILNKEIVKAVHLPEVKEKFLSTGIDVVGSTPAQFATAIDKEIRNMRRVIQETGMRAD